MTIACDLSSPCLALQNGQLSLVQTCWLSAANSCDGSLTRNEADWLDQVGLPPPMRAQQRDLAAAACARRFRRQRFAEVENSHRPGRLFGQQELPAQLRVLDLDTRRSRFLGAVQPASNTAVKIEVVADHPCSSPARNRAVISLGTAGRQG